jgi:hypothetical protein
MVPNIKLDLSRGQNKRIDAYAHHVGDALERADPATEGHDAALAKRTEIRDRCDANPAANHEHLHAKLAQLRAVAVPTLQRA